MIPCFRPFAAVRTAATALLFAASLSAQTDPSAAEGQSPVLTGEKVILSATRQATPAFDLPQSAAAIEVERLRAARILQDGLREVPGVLIQRTSQGQTSPYIRGLTGYHTLLLLDGVRLNNSILRSGPNEYWGLVDGQSLSGAELISGPGSALYGSDAVGGTLAAQSRRREDYSEEFGFDVMTRARVASAEQSWLLRSEVQGNFGQEVGFLLGGTYADYGDVLRGGDFGVQPDTSYDAVFGDAAIDWNLDDHWTIGLTARVSELDDVPRTHATVNATSYRGTVAGSDLRRDLTFERDLLILGLKGQDLDSFFQEMDVKLVYTQLEETENRIRSNGVRNLQGFEVDTFGIAVQLTTEFDVGRLTYGVDWYHDEVDSFADNFAANGTFTGSGIQGQVSDDASYDLVGVFAQYELPIGEAVDLIAAGRFTYAAVEAGRFRDPVTGSAASFDDDYLDASFSLRAIGKPTDSVRLFGGVAQAFRAPNLSDLTRLDVARSGELEIASLDLDPERFVTFEVGGRYEDHGFYAEALYFYTLIDDLIIRQPTGNTVGSNLEVRKRNAGDGHIQGIEFKTSYAFTGNWTAFGTFSWTDGQVESFPTSAPISREEPLTRLTPMRGTVGLRYDTTERDFYARLWLEGDFGQDRLSSSDVRDTQRVPPGGSPSWMTINVEAGYEINEHAEAFLAIENLADVDYRRHGSGINEPGINLIAGVELKF